jgi:hypothetical protein
MNEKADGKRVVTDAQLAEWLRGVIAKMQKIEAYPMMKQRLTELQDYGADGSALLYGTQR